MLSNTSLVAAILCALCLSATVVTALSPANVPYLTWTGTRSERHEASVDVDEIKSSIHSVNQLLKDTIRTSEVTPEVAVLFIQDELSADRLSRQLTSADPSCQLPLTHALSQSRSILADSQEAKAGTPLESFEGRFPNVQRIPSHNVLAYLKSIEFAEAVTDGKTDALVVSLDTFSCAERDNVISKVISSVNKLTKGAFLAILTSKQAWAHHEMSELQTMTNAHAATDSLAHEHLSLLQAGTAGGPISWWYTHNLYLTPGILSGILFGFLFLMLAATGFCCLTSIQGPDRFEQPHARMNLANKE